MYRTMLHLKIKNNDLVNQLDLSSNLTYLINEVSTKKGVDD